jgi:hypothetical protein
MPKRKTMYEALFKKLDGVESSLKKIENFVDSQDHISTENLRRYLESGFHRRPLSRIFRNKKAFNVCVSMLAQGRTYKDIAKALSNIRGFGYISKSSVGRFWGLYMGIIRER